MANAVDHLSDQPELDSLRVMITAPSKTSLIFPTVIDIVRESTFLTDETLQKALKRFSGSSALAAEVLNGENVFVTTGGDHSHKGNAQAGTE